MDFNFKKIMTVWGLALVAFVFSALILESCESNKSNDKTDTVASIFAEDDNAEDALGSKKAELIKFLNKDKRGSYDDFRDACSHNDYKAARKMLEKQEDKVEKMRESMFTRKKKRIAAQSQLSEDWEYLEEKETNFFESLANKACEKEDFELAYLVIDEWKKLNTGSAPDGIKQTIVEKEMRYLVTLNREDAAKKIAYILKDNFNPSSVEEIEEELIDLAHKLGNDYVESVLKSGKAND